MPGTLSLGLSIGLLGFDPGVAILASWNDGHALVANRELVRAEVDAILEDSGIHIRWTDTEAELKGALPVVVVVTPSEPSGDGWHLSPSAMGVYLSTAESNSIFVFYHRVARAAGVAAGKEGLMVPSDRKRLARALGRVVLHELVHRIAPHLPHAESGVMRGDLGGSLLTRQRLPLDDASNAAILEALRANTASYLYGGPRTK